MKLQVYKNKFDDNYKVLQKQRLNDGTTAYQTVQVGTGFEQETPSGEKYLVLKIKGRTDNATQRKRKKE